MVQVKGRLDEGVLFDTPLVLLADSGLALMFLWAAAAKARDWYGLLRTLRDQIGVTHKSARRLARLIPWVEAIVGFGLLVNAVRDVAVWCALALLAVFSGVMIFALTIGKRNLKCNCFGEGDTFHETRWLVARNLFLLVVALLCAWSTPTRPALLIDRIVAMVTVAGLFTALSLAGGLQTIAAYRREIVERDVIVLGGMET
jgi:hypothetical protein